jgi:hypothetical protein
MAWLTKIIEVLKIPMKVLLPAAWLFSAAMTLFSNSWLEKLGLLQWKEESQFVLGLIFLITSCLILVYVFIYFKGEITNIISKLSMNRTTIKAFLKMSNTEKAIILKVYHSPNITCELDYSHPIIHSLLARRYLYSGGEQLVTPDIFSNAMLIKLTLQPFIFNALNYYKEKLAKDIKKTEKKLGKAKKQSKINKLNGSLEVLKGYYEIYFNGDRYHR